MRIYIENSVHFILFLLKKGFQNVQLDEDLVENADTTHFVFSLDKGKTLSFIYYKKVRYADIVSGVEQIPIMVRILGGKNAVIQPPMIIFKSQD